MNDSVTIEIASEVKSLATHLKEFSDSLLRMEGEKELQKAIAEKVESELNIKPTHFKKAATAYFKDKLSDLRDDTAQQYHLFNSILE